MTPDATLPTRGRIVMYVMKDGETVRPIMVTEVMPDLDTPLINGVLFFDGPNDHGNFPNDQVHESNGVKQLCTGWVSLVPFDETGSIPGTWHWPHILRSPADPLGFGVPGTAVRDDVPAGVDPPSGQAETDDPFSSPVNTPPRRRRSSQAAATPAQSAEPETAQPETDTPTSE